MKYYWKSVRKGIGHNSKQILSPLRGSHLQAYVSVCSAYCKTLKSLHLGDRVHCTNDKPMNMEKYSRLLSRLHDFTQLNELEVKVYTKRSVFELESIVDRCPSSLQKLCFSASQPNPALSFESGVRDQGNLDLVRPYPNIKTFEGDRLMLTDSSTHYLMHKCPNVNRLIINKIGRLLRSMVIGGDNDMGSDEFKADIRRVYECEGTLD
jgi:hypothetical protein